MRPSRIARRVGSAALGALVAATSSFAQETTERISVDSSGVEGDNYSHVGAIAADARFVVVWSHASNLVANDTNASSDVFVRDRSTGITERISVDSSAAEADSYSYYGAISADGRFVAFESLATNLVTGDTNGFSDVFVHDRTTGATERVSVDSSGAEGDDHSFAGGISADGRLVAFWSRADNLVAMDMNRVSDVFVHDRSTGITERVSVDSSGAEGDRDSGLYGVAISADGEVVAFLSKARNLVAGDTNGLLDIFVHDRSTAATERVSVRTNGNQENGDSGPHPAISSDGSIVAFSSVATNLVIGDTNGQSDVFVHDRSTGMTRRVSVDSTGAEGNQSSNSPAISADGQIVAFDSLASNLIVGDTNGYEDVFVHDRSTGTIGLVSVDSSGVQGNWNSSGPSITADGQIVAFDSDAKNLVAGDTNGRTDAFVNHRCLIDAAWSNYGSGFPGTHGVPAFTARANPVLGTTLALDLANSSGSFTLGVLFVGFQQTSIHSSWGGDLVVVPEITTVIGVPTNGASFLGDLPFDVTLCGFEIDLQAIESDPGAVHGVSFTPGLELVLGR